MEILFVTLLIGHFFGDFVMQTDGMALKKSSNNWVLLGHVAIYSWTVTILSAAVEPLQMAKIFFMTMVTHFVIDYFTSRKAKSYFEKGDRHMFFVTIGFDQVLHILQLFLTAIWVTKY